MNKKVARLQIKIPKVSRKKKTGRFHSFVPLLNEALLQFRPQRILEWGMGKSTEIMDKTEGVEEIHTFEHDVKWFNHYKGKFSDKVKCNLLPLDKGYAVAGNMFTPNYFDFAFVDGERMTRVQCMKTSMTLVKKGGIVMLHDSERAMYKEGINLFKKVKDGNITVLMINE